MTLSDLKDEIAKLESNFQLFRNFRGQTGLWDKAIRRDMESTVAPELSPYQEGLDFQSPALEKAVQDFKAVLAMNPTLFDFYVYGEGQTYRDLESRLLFVVSRAWDEMNFNRVFDKGVGEGQTKYGVAHFWLRYRKKSEHEEQKWPFYLQYCPADTVLHPMPELSNEPDVFYYSYVVPVVGNGLRKSDKQKATLDGMGKIGWLGAAEPWDTTSLQDKKIKVIVRDGRKLSGEMCPLDGCDHPLREITVYVQPEDGKEEDAEEVETYDSPFPCSSFFIIAGNEQVSESDPHHRYRPLMAALYYLQLWQNHVITTLATVSRNQSSNEMYLDVGTASPELLAQYGILKEGGYTTTIDRITPGENQEAVYPGQWRRFPRETSQYLMELINLIGKLIAEAMPNRFMTGTAYQEASNATGTAFLATLQQASIPFDSPLSNTDAAIYKILMGCLHAIRYWGHFEPDETKTKWAVVTTSGQHVMRYEDKYGMGQKLYVTADDLNKCAYDIVLKTENLTQAQKDALWMQAKDKYFSGFYTPQQTWKDIGINDTVKQSHDMFAAKVDAVLEPLAMEEAKMRAIMEFSAQLGFDLRQFLPPTGEEGSMPEQAVPNQGEGSMLGQPPAPQMGRSAQQLEYAVGINGPGPSGGALPT